LLSLASDDKLWQNRGAKQYVNFRLVFEKKIKNLRALIYFAQNAYYIILEKSASAAIFLYFLLNDEYSIGVLFFVFLWHLW